MKNIFLIFTLILINTGYCGVQTVELIYNEAEIYNGNEISIKLKVTNKSGKVFLSDIQRKYDLSQFVIKTSDNVKIVSSYQKYLKLYINDYNESQFITINLQYYYGTQKKFEFKIPIITYNGNLKGVKFAPNNHPIKANSIFKIGIIGQLESGDFFNVSAHGKLNYDMFKFTVLEGGYLLNKSGEIQIGNYDYCNPNLKIRVELIEDSSIFIISDFNIINNFKQKTYVNFTNKKASDLNIKIDVFYDHCLKDSLLKIVVFDDFDSTLSVYHLKLGTEILIINTGGINGRDGVNGHNGGASLNGGNGGDGIDGTDGKDVYIYFTDEAEKFKLKIIIKSKGGIGGRYGKGGRGTRVNVCTNDITRTVYGSNGIPGRDGRNGKDGTVHYILVTK